MASPALNPKRPGPGSASYAYTLLTVSLCTAVAWLMFPHMDLANLIMVYLLGIVALSYWQGMAPSVVASFLSVLAFDFFFVPPRFTFAVADTQYLFMFLVMLLVGLSISSLAAQLRHQAEHNQKVQVQIESEKLRSSLLSSVSHDLRTPLAAITGSTSSLLQDGEDLPAATRKDLLENIHDESERLERLVNNLLEMTQLESGSIKPNQEPNHPAEVIGSALARLDRKSSGRRITTRIPEDLPLVPMDSLLIEQVVVNLVDNALKYTPADSPVEITVGAGKGSLEVEVADRGPGLPGTDLPRLFDKFYRGPEQGRATGSGLGLSICKGFVQIHGGTIEAANRPGGGAVFRFTLPLEAKDGG